MISFAQRKPDKLQKSIFHHALINLIVLEQLKKEGKDWPTFLFVSNYQIDLPPSPSKLKTPKKKTATPPIASSVPSSEIPQSSAPSAPSFEVAQDSSPSAPTLEIAQPSASTVPSASETPQSPQDLIPQRPLPVQVYKRDKRKGKAQEVVVEDQTEPLVELPPMEIEDNPPTIQARVDTPALRRSSRRKLVLAEESLPSSDVVKPRARLSRFKVSPLEKEALEAIVQLSESPPESAPETEQGPRENWAKLFKDADRQLKEVQEKNQRLHQENVTLGRQLSSQIDELAGECNQLKKNIRKR
jgi:hypothetical protein